MPGRTGVNRRADHGYWYQAKVADKEDLFQVGDVQNIENDVVLRGRNGQRRFYSRFFAFLKVALQYLELALTGKLSCHFKASRLKTGRFLETLNQLSLPRRESASQG
jgi:hypothetical protein